MKRKIYFFALLSAVIITALSSCTKDVDLNNIDPQVEADMALAVPVGTASIQFGDILDIFGSKYPKLKDYVRVENNMITCFFKDTLDADFHPIHLENYVTNTQQDIIIKNYLPAEIQTLISSTGSTIPANSTFSLTYKMPIKLNRINNDIASERLDYANIDSARFTTVLAPSDLPMRFSDIKRLTMKLPVESFTLNGQNPNGGFYEVNIPVIGKDFNQQIPINIYDFVLNLQTNQDTHTVTDQINLEFVFDITTSQDIPVTGNSAILYNMNVDFLEYSSVYGYFRPSSLVSDTAIVPLFASFGDWEHFPELFLPISEPRVTLNTFTTIGAPLMFIIHNLSSYSSKNPNDVRNATFNESKEDHWSLNNFVQVTDPLGTVARNHREYDNGPLGRLDNLFAVRPDYISFAYETIINTAYTNITQHRLEKDTRLYVETTVETPLAFKPGVKVQYIDTITDVNIDEIKIDSLIKDVDYVDSIKAASLKLVINAESWIPMDLIAEFKFYNAKGEQLDFHLQETSDALTIPGPTTDEYYRDTKNNDTQTVQNPKLSTFIFNINDKDLDILSQTKYITYSISLGDNEHDCMIYANSDVKLKIGLAADVSALANLNFNNEEK